MRIGFIGLGQMGRGMAQRLLAAGHELVVWNRTPAAAEELRARGARVANAPSATLDSDVVVSMLADDAAVQAVWVEAALVRHLPRSTIHLNMASVSVRLSKQLAYLHRQNAAGYVAAPVFGRPEFAARGELDIIAAGDAAALERCKPVFETLGRRWFNVGAEPQHANAVKIARNFVLAMIVESLGESFALIEGSGVSCETFLDIITSTSMNAPAYKDYGRRILRKPPNPTFALRLGLKDIELTLDAAHECGITLPSAALIRDHHLAAIAAGYGDKDWAELGNWFVEKSLRRPVPGGLP